MSAATHRFVVFGFASVHDALGAESALRNADVAVTAIPSPRELGELCGVALRIEPSTAATAKAVFAVQGIIPRGTVEIEDL